MMPNNTSLHYMFAAEMLQKLEEDEKILQHVILPDESMFYVSLFLSDTIL